MIVLVEDDGSGTRADAREEAEVSPIASIDPTRSAARVGAVTTPASRWTATAAAGPRTARSWR